MNGARLRIATSVWFALLAACGGGGEDSTTRSSAPAPSPTTSPSGSTGAASDWARRLGLRDGTIGHALLGSSTVSAGASHSAALKSDGTVWAWGSNSVGQLGVTNPVFSYAPMQVTGLADVVKLATSSYHTVALRSDGSAWAWGYNACGQLGNNNTEVSFVPVAVSGLTDVRGAAAGHNHTVALKADGTVWTWGCNAFGELGNSSTANSLVPVQVPGLTSVVGIAAGGNHTVVLKSDGTVWAWGYNGFGELGNNSTLDSLVPVQVVGLSSVASISASVGHRTIALKADGTVWTWGANSAGDLGNNSGVRILVPVQVPGLTSVVGIAAGGNHTVVLKSDGTVWTWGIGAFGPEGFTFGGPAPGSLVPELTSVVDVAAGGWHTVALKSDGTVWAWGANDQAQLGNPNFAYSLVPVQVLGPGGVGFLSLASGGGGVVAPPSSCSLVASPSSLPVGGGSVTLTASCASGGTPSSFSWAGGFAQGSTTTASSFTGNLAATTTFTVVASNAAGSSTVAAVTVTVTEASPPPASCSIVATPSALPIGGGSVTLSASCASGGVPTTFNWTGGFADGLTTTTGVVTGNVIQTTTFAVVAQNLAGSSSPGNVTVTVLLPPVGLPRLFALVIGQNDLARVRGDRGAEQVFDVLKAKSTWAPISEGNSSTAYKIVGDPNTDRALRDQVNIDIFTQLERIRLNVRAGDTFVFYVNAHVGKGTAGNPEAPTNGFLDVRDEIFGWGISDDTLANYFEAPEWRNVRKIFLLDTCYSGGFWGGGLIDEGDLNRLTNVAILASSQEEQLSFSTLGTGVGIWTEELLLPALSRAALTVATLRNDISSSYLTRWTRYLGQSLPVLALDINAPGTSALFTSPTPFFAASSDFNLNEGLSLALRDSVAPTTIATTSAPPNSHGWNSTSVTVTLRSADNPSGSGIKEIHFELRGAQSTSATLPGASANVLITSDGVTTLTYFSTDNAGNVEEPKTLVVRIDTTPPVISGLPANCSLWPPNHRMAQVATIAATDTASGLESFNVFASSSEAARRGETDISISGSGNGARVISLRAERSGTGASRTYTITAVARNLAGRSSTAAMTCTVAHDQGAHK